MESNQAGVAKKRRIDDDIKAEEDAVSETRSAHNQLSPAERSSMLDEFSELSLNAEWDAFSREIIIQTARRCAHTNDTFLMQIINAKRCFTSKEAQKGREGITSGFEVYAPQLRAMPSDIRARYADIVPLIVEDFRGYDEQIRPYHSYPRKHEVLTRFITAFDAILAVRSDFGKKLRTILEHGGFDRLFTNALCRVKNDWEKLVVDKSFMEKLDATATTCYIQDAFMSIPSITSRLTRFALDEEDRKLELAEQRRKKKMLEDVANASIEVFREIEDLRRSLAEKDSVEEKAQCLKKIADLTNQKYQQWKDLAKQHGKQAK